MRSQPRKMISHVELIKAARRLDYTLHTEGLCNGVAFVAILAFLGGKLQEFDDRLLKIGRALEDEDYGEALSEEDVISIYAFFDSVMLLQAPHKNPDILGAHIHEQHATAALPLLTTVELQKKGGVQPLATFVDSYTKSEFESFLKDIQISSLVNKSPVAMAVSGVYKDGVGSHTVAIGYDPEDKAWHFIDANQLPTLKFGSAGEIAEKIQNIYEGNKQNFSVGVQPFSLKNKHLEADIEQLQKKVVDHLKLEKLDHLDSKGTSLLGVALGHGSDEWIRNYIENDALKVERNNDVIVGIFSRAITNEDEELIKLMLDKGVDVNITNNNKTLSPLALAVLEKKYDIVKMLLRGGADPNTQYNHLDVLRIAVSHQDINLVKLLLKSGANPNTVTQQGNSPLHYASKVENKELCEVLISYGADIELRNKQNRSPLDIAKNTTDDISQFLEEKSEKYAKRFLAELKKYIANSEWSVSGLGGKTILIGDKKTTVPEHVKRQWDVIKSAEEGTLRWRDAAKEVVEIAANVKQKTGRRTATKEYYQFFKSKDIETVRNKMKAPGTESRLLKARNHKV